MLLILSNVVHTQIASTAPFQIVNGHQENVIFHLTNQTSQLNDFSKMHKNVGTLKIIAKQ